MSITRSDDSRYGHLRDSSQSAPHSEVLRFRTPNPIPYSEPDAGSGLKLNVSLFCEGECEWAVCDASVFSSTCVPGATLNEQLENELSLALEIALTKVSEGGIAHSDLPQHSDELGAHLAEDLFPLWRERRGIQATRFRLTSVIMIKPVETKDAELRLEPAPAAPAVPVDWVCPNCGRVNHENFCTKCGMKRPE